MENHRLHWGLPQWVAFLRDKDIPIMPRLEGTDRGRSTGMPCRRRNWRRSSCRTRSSRCACCAVRKSIAARPRHDTTTIPRRRATGRAARHALRGGRQSALR